MKRRFVVLLLLASVACAGSIPSHGCAPANASAYAVGATTIDSFVTPDGRTRDFRVFYPATAAAAPPAPLVFLFHGGMGSAQLAQSSFRMDGVASSNGFVTVYPNGVSKTWNAGICCGQAMALGVDDVLFVSLLLDHIAARLCIDLGRVYASGLSNGGIFSHRLGCELSERFAAVAPVEGTMGLSDCTPAEPVSVLMVHGTSDVNVPWSGGVGCATATNFSSIKSSADKWITANGACLCPTFEDNSTCTAADTAISAGDGNCVSYGPCSSGSEVTLCSGPWGHSWPGGADGISILGCNGTASKTFIASEAIWTFFSRHHKEEHTSKMPSSTSLNWDDGASSASVLEVNIWVLAMAAALLF